MATTTPPTRRTTGGRLALAVAAVGFALYLPAVRHGFVFDDGVVIVENPLLRSAAALPALLTRTEWSGGGYELRLYRPLTGLTYAANYALSGLTPWSYHLVNALLHALCAALLLVLGLRLGLGRLASGAAALLFAVHPVHVEAVANVVGRKDLLATALLLLMALAHLRARSGRPRDVAVAVLAYAGAMLAKEVGVVGIGLVAALDVTFPALATDPGAATRPGPRRRLAAPYAAYAAALVLYLLLLRSVTAGAGAATFLFEDNPAAFAPALQRVLTAVALFGKGLGLQLLPLAQSPDYSYPAIPLVTSALDPRFLLGAAALAGWAAAGVALRRRAPVVLGSLGWYGISLLPASNLLFPVGTIFGERLLYLPGAGLALLAGAGVAAVAPRLPRPAALAAGAAVLVALGAATVRYSEAWASEESLFRWAERTQPGSAKVHQKLAILELERAPERALAEIDRSLALYEADPQAHLVRAAALRRLGRPGEEAEVRRALALEPRIAEGNYEMGRLAREAGRLDEAAAWWRRAIAADPTHAAALGDLASWHLVRGELAPALDLATRAVQADPGLATAWYTLALVHQARREPALARAAYQRFAETAGPEYAAEVAQVRAMLAAGGP